MSDLFGSALTTLGRKCEIDTHGGGGKTAPTIHADATARTRATSVPALAGDVLGEGVAWPPPRPKRRREAPRTAEDVAESLRRKRRRYELTRVAGSVLHEKDTHWKEQHRTVWCHRGTHRTADRPLPVYRTAVGTSARLADVTTCGQGWTCPVCAAKITEHRRSELRIGMERHCGAGGGIYLVSLTLPHQADQALEPLLLQLLDASIRLKNCRKWKATMEAAGYVGAVKGLEVTVGLNGWHPHIHMLLLTNRGGLGEGAPNDEGDLSSRAIDTLKLEWVRLLLKVGAITQQQASDTYKHGLNVRGGDKAAEYIAKYGEDQWGLAREVASLHAKIGVRGQHGGFHHFTPFQLLEIADAEGPYKQQARALFREFAAAFKSRRMLTWSPGLKKHLGIAELDQPVPGEEFQVGEITHQQFSTLVRTNRVGAFIEYVAQECESIFIAQDLIDAFIDRCSREHAARGSGEILTGVEWHGHYKQKEGMSRYQFQPEDHGSYTR